MKITRFTREHCKSLREEIDQALSELASKHGINIKTGSATFSDSNVTFKLELATLAQNGTVMTKEAEALKLYATIIGLPSDALGKQFMSQGKMFELIGYKPKATKYPLIAKCLLTGQKYKFTTDSVKRNLQP